MTVAATVLAGQTALVLGTGGSLVVRLAGAVATALSLLLRRRRPLFPLAVAVADGLLLGELPLALPAAAYALTRHHPRLRGWWVVPFVLGMFFLGPRAERDLASPGVIPLLLFILVVVPALAGALVRARVELAARPGLTRAPGP